MRDALAACRRQAGQSCGEIDFAELPRLARTGMRYADQLDISVTTRDRSRKSSRVKRVAGHGFASRWQHLRGAGARTFADQYPHLMPARNQCVHDRHADIAGGGGYDYYSRLV